MTTVALFGATGLVGGECLRLLENDPIFTRVVTFTRRPLVGVGKKVEQQILELDNLEKHAAALAVDQVICALGTTIRKAGSQPAFRKVDFDYPLAIARLALSQGARHFLLVSALGANPRSRVFYSRVKGEIEAAVSALPFRSVTIVRPSMLAGRRTEVRRGEQIAEWLAFLVPGNYKPVAARAVARALVVAAHVDSPGRRIIESKEIRMIAAGAEP